MTRGYRSVARAQGAQATRRRVVVAAADLFTAQGYAATSVRQIAREAKVALDRVYALGNKAQVFAAALETVLSGRTDGIPLLQSPELEAIWDSPTLEAVIDGLAAANLASNRRGVGIWTALIEGAGSDPALARVMTDQDEAMRNEARRVLQALTLRGLCPLPEDPARVADLIWTLGHPSRYALLTRHAGWSEEEFHAQLADDVLRLLRG